MSSRLVPVLLAAAALALPALSPIEAQTESHPIVGTWSLDLARSSFDPAYEVWTDAAVYAQVAGG